MALRIGYNSPEIVRARRRRVAREKARKQRECPRKVKWSRKAGRYICPKRRG